ncbi:MAG: hypothetical protein QXO75_07255, partial [Nitrososphaerota archaeon]
IALGISAFSMIYEFSPWVKGTLILLLASLLMMQYYGYTLSPLYFDMTYILIFMPISYFRKKMKWSLLLLFSANIIFFIFSSAYSALPLLQGNSSSLGAFPYFRPLNLIHEQANLGVSRSFIQDLTGLNFNISFFKSLSNFEHAILFVLVVIVIIQMIEFETKGLNKCKVTLMIIFALLIVMNMPYKNNISLISTLPVYLVSHHIVTYQHLGIILTAFDVNRLILFPYYALLALLIGASSSSVIIKSKKKNIVKPKETYRKYSKATIPLVAVLLVIVLLLASSSLSLGEYSYASINVESPTYAYASSSKLPDDRTLLYSNPFMFYPGNFYPSYEQMQQDIPDLPMFMNFVNVESSPLVNALLNTMPPSDFVFRSGTEPFLTNYTTSEGYNIIHNSPENVTTGYPVFVIGSMETFDQYLLTHYFTNQYSAKYTSYKDATENLGRFSYYEVPNNYTSCLYDKGGIVEINLNASINTTEKSIGYYFGFSSNDTSQSNSGDLAPSITIASINSRNQALSLYNGDPVSLQLLGSNYVSFGNMFSYDKQTNIPFRGNSSGNITIILYGLGNSEVEGFIDYHGYWYQSVRPFPVTDINYFYSDAYLSTLGILYNFTISKLAINSHYINLIPIYYDSMFSNLSSLKSAIEDSNILIYGRNYNESDLIGSETVIMDNVTNLQPSAYAIDYQGEGWYQVFSGDPAQSALYAQYIPPVLFPDQVGYSDYYGYAQSFSNNTSLDIPVNTIGNRVIGLNILFSPGGGNISVNTGSQTNIIFTESDHPYYSWVFLNVSMDGKLKITNINGIQSINDISILTVKQFSFLERFTDALLKGKSYFKSMAGKIQFIGGQFTASPVSFFSILKITNSSLPIIVEYPSPLYSNFHTLISTGSYLNILSWGYFPSQIIYNTTSAVIVDHYYQHTSILSEFIPLIPLISIPLIYFVSIMYARKRKKV